MTDGMTVTAFICVGFRVAAGEFRPCTRLEQPLGQAPSSRFQAVTRRHGPFPEISSPR